MQHSVVMVKPGGTGRPARVIRSVSEADLRRLAGLRGGDLALPPRTAITVEHTQETVLMGQLYEYRGILPTIAASAFLFPTAEITGDVVVGERLEIGGVERLGCFQLHQHRRRADDDRR